MRSIIDRGRGRVGSYGKRAESRVQQAWRRALVVRATDWTESTARRSCLVLAAHPDDETFACGATVLRKTDAGTPVKVFIATDGRNANPSSKTMTPAELGGVRRSESAEVGRLLGLHGEDLIQLEHENLRAEDRVADVRRRIEALVADFRPDEILVNSALDYHPDHRAMNRLVHELVDRGAHTGRVAEYPIWYLFDGPWTRTDEALSDRPTHAGPAGTPSTQGRSVVGRAWRRVEEPVTSVVRRPRASVATGPYLDRKRAAVAAYRSQVTNYTGEESWGYLHDNFVSLFLTPQELFFPWPGTR